MQADQLVYSFAGPIQKFKMAQKETQKLQFICDKDKKFIRHEVETAFLECWKLQQQQDSIQALYKASQSTFAKNEHAHQLKLVNKSDWFKNISDHASNLTTIENYYQDLEISQKKLEFFMGQPIDLALTKLAKPVGEISPKNIPLTTLSLEWSAPQKYSLLPINKCYAYAQKNRDDLRIATKDIEIAQDATYIANRANLPEIKVNASTGYYGQETLLPGGTTTAYALGVKVSWNLFNGLLHDFEAKAAHATMLKEILNKEQANQTIIFEVDQAHNALKQIITKLKAKKLDLLCAKNNLMLSKQQLAIGEISKVDYDAAYKEWELKYFEWLALKTDAAIKSRDLAYACGYPKELS
jgi:outer membrane protein TolC